MDCCRAGWAAGRRGTPVMDRTGPAARPGVGQLLRLGLSLLHRIGARLARSALSSSIEKLTVAPARRRRPLPGGVDDPAAPATSCRVAVTGCHLVAGDPAVVRVVGRFSPKGRGLQVGVATPLLFSMLISAVACRVFAPGRPARSAPGLYAEHDRHHVRRAGSCRPLAAVNTGHSHRPRAGRERCSRRRSA